MPAEDPSAEEPEVETPLTGGPEVETPLTGGIANVGQVVRVGDTVRRPGKSQSKTVQAFLEHLHLEGITEVPYPLGFDAKGREVLGFIEGFAPTEPYPPWITDDALMLAVAQLQRRLHLAATRFRIPEDAVWGTGGNYFPPQAEGPIVCQNDLGISNVILGNNRLRGVIDFDYARPVTPLFDIAVAVRHWVPFAAPEDLGAVWGGPTARINRFRLFCEVHSLDSADRHAVIDLAALFLDQARSNIAALASNGHVGFQQLIASGYLYRNSRTVDWLRSHTAQLVGAF